MSSKYSLLFRTDHMSNDYINDIISYLDLFLKYNKKKKICMIFDIDDTLIMYSSGKSNDNMKKIYKWGLKQKCYISFITARILSNQNVDFTKRQLIEHGFGLYDSLYLMPESYYKYGKIGLYKYNVRQFLEKKYICMFNAGDQWTDLMPIAPSITSSKQEYILLQNLNSKGIYLKLPQSY